MGMSPRLQELAKDALHKTALAAKLLCFLHVTDTYICSVAKLVGPSMIPTFNQGNFVLAESLTTRSGKIESGDVVFVRRPDIPNRVVAKRVKGVEGDVVSYPTLGPDTSDEYKTVVVPKGHVWVEGDNLHESIDSRKFGPVPYGLLQARVFFVLWPPADFRSIGNKAQ